MITEASTKANKLHVMHSAKQIGKIKDDEERERQAKDLEKKAKKLGLNRADVEKILDDQGAYGEEYEMKKPMKTFIEFKEDNKDALRRALAIQKFKRGGGKVEKQPPSPATGSKKYRGMYMAAPKTKEDEKMAQDIQKYRKKMGKKQRYFPQGKSLSSLNLKKR